MRSLKNGTIIAAAWFLLSCAPARTSTDIPGSPPALPDARTEPQTALCAAYREVGTASWYGMDFHGRKTASGETFDMNGISAAHRTLPLGVTVRVTNLDNYKSIAVRVNDRGPLYRNRAIELSYGAAKELGFADAGTAPVKIELVGPLPAGEEQFMVHAASFLEEESALSLKERLAKKYESVHIDTVETNVALYYRVRVGTYPTEEKAERVAARLTLEGVEPVVLRKDY